MLFADDTRFRQLGEERGQPKLLPVPVLGAESPLLSRQNRSVIALPARLTARPVSRKTLYKQTSLGFGILFTAFTPAPLNRLDGLFLDLEALLRYLGEPETGVQAPGGYAASL